MTRESMKKAALVVPPVFEKDRIFDPNNPHNLDDRLAFFRDLRINLSRRGYDLKTQDLHSVEESDLCIYNDLPRQGQLAKFADKSHLLVFESHLIRGRNWSRRRHNMFKTVLVWNDDWVDNRKYFKLNFPHRFPAQIANASTERSKLCVMVASGLKSFHPLELYSERLKTIRWFERHHPADFELYGRGWEKVVFVGPPAIRALNWVPKLRELSTPRLTSWRGPVKEKKTIYGDFRFSICYENAENIKGYITEKIFDCFFGGIVPVYWGAPDISLCIPEACYVDRKRFRSHEELYDFMKNMPAGEYGDRLTAIQNFLNSRRADPFRVETVAEQVASVVTGGPPLMTKNVPKDERP